jgi:hypothetical protein
VNLGTIMKCIILLLPVFYVILSANSNFTGGIPRRAMAKVGAHINGPHVGPYPSGALEAFWRPQGPH